MTKDESRPKWRPKQGGKVPYASAVDGNPYAKVGERTRAEYAVADALEKVQKNLGVPDTEEAEADLARDKKMASVAFGQDFDHRRTDPRALRLAQAIDRVRSEFLAQQRAGLDLTKHKGIAARNAAEGLRSPEHERIPNPEYDPYQEGSPESINVPNPASIYDTMLSNMVAADGKPSSLDVKPRESLLKRLPRRKTEAEEWHTRLKEAVERATTGEMDPKEPLRLANEYLQLVDENDKEQEQENQERSNQKDEDDERREMERAMEEAKAQRNLKQQMERNGSTDAERKAAEAMAEQERDARERRRMTEEEAAREGKRPPPSEGAAKWGDMEIVNLPLQRPHRGKMKLRSPKFYRRDAGAVIRYAHRHAIDRNVFGEKQRKNPRAAILLDASGSMSVPMESVLRIMELAPGCTIAAYSGDHQTGWLRILAHKGRCVDEKGLDHLRQGVGNTIDGPSLRWLAKQNAMKLWVSDGHVTNRHGRCTREAIFDAFDVVRRNRIRHVLTLDDCITLLESGRLMDSEKVTGRRRELGVES